VNGEAVETKAHEVKRSLFDAATANRCRRRTDWRRAMLRVCAATESRPTGLLGAACPGGSLRAGRVGVSCHEILRVPETLLRAAILLNQCTPRSRRRGALTAWRGLDAPCFQWRPWVDHILSSLPECVTLLK